MTRADAPASVMFLAVHQMLGRQRSIAWRGAHNGPQLGLTAADLRVLAAIEVGNPVALWKYAQNREVAVSSPTPLTVLDQLGTYALYQDNGHSLRLDDATPEPADYLGSGVRLRAEARRLYDKHVAQYDANRGLLVRRWYPEEASDPIYAADPSPDPCIPLLVEGLPVPVWVFGPEPTSEEDGEANHYLMYMVGFWLWQMTDALAPAVVPQGPTPTPVHIRLDLGDRQRFRSSPITNPTDLGAVSVSGNTIEVRFGDGNWSELSQEDNRGERTVMKLVAQGFRDLAARNGIPGVLSDDAIRTELDRNFDNPRRKHLLLLEPTNPSLAPGALPRYRRVQAADRTEIKYQLGRQVRAQLGLDRGPVPAARRTDVLGTARDWCLAEIERAAAELSPDGLLERLMGLVESLTRSAVTSKLKMPTRLACYESDERTRARLMQEQPHMSVAAIAYRFLIEYVTAVPPTGTVSVSATAVDWLVALVAELVNIAMFLDALTTELSDPELSFNEHDELAIGAQEAYVRAQSSFLETYTEEVMANAEGAFSRNWSAPQPAPTLLEPEVSALDTAVAHETGGPSVMEMRAFVEALAELGLDLGGEPNVLSRGDIEAKLTSKLGWSTTKVAAGIEFLLLQPRGAFYSPATPPAWSKGDVQPWRFNRRLSYLRRPLIQRDTSSGEQLLWGIRHVWESWPLQLAYMQRSKFKATSPQLIKLLGHIGKQRGKEFEEKVADLYERYPHYRVLRGRKKFNGKTITRPGMPGQTLGDVDVLVAYGDQKVLEAVEAKDIAMALTPSELADELGTYFETGDRAKHSAAMERHTERVHWLRDNIVDVLATFRPPITDASGWIVDGLFVTVEPVPSPHIIRPAMPILSYRELEDRIRNPPRARRPAQRKRRARRS